MQLRDLIIGSNIWFIRDGTVIAGEDPDPGTIVSPDVQPAFATTKEHWLKLGSVENWEPRTTTEWVSRRAAPEGKGKYQTRIRLPLSSSLTHAFGLQEFSELDFELLLNAATIDSSTGEYVPNSRGEALVGWIHIEGFNQGDLEIINETSWVQLSKEAFQFGENLNPHTLMAEVLYNELNEGKISNLSATP